MVQACAGHDCIRRAEAQRRGFLERRGAGAQVLRDPMQSVRRAPSVAGIAPENRVENAVGAHGTTSANSVSMPAERYVVLVGMDFSKLADRAFSKALELTMLHGGGELHVLHVLSIAEADGLEDACLRLHSHVQLLLEDILDGVQPSRQPRVTSHVRVNNPSAGLIQMASDLGTDLIVLGTHGREGLDRWLVGSVSESTASHSRCPVLIVPPHEPNHEMVIEPPCPDCVLAQHTSGGLELWCQHHQDRHGRRHTYHQDDRMIRDSNFPLVLR